MNDDWIEQIAVAGYDGTGSPHSLDVCGRCGALVLSGSTEIHDEWHARLKTNVTMAGFGMGGLTL